jgi:hypothetical protein
MRTRPASADRVDTLRGPEHAGCRAHREMRVLFPRVRWQRGDLAVAPGAAADLTCAAVARTR